MIDRNPGAFAPQPDCLPLPLGEVADSSFAPPWTPESYGL